MFFINIEDDFIELSQGRRERIEEIDADIDQLDEEQGAQAGEEIAYLTKERSDILSKRSRLSSDE